MKFLRFFLTLLFISGLVISCSSTNKDELGDQEGVEVASNDDLTELSEDDLSNLLDEEIVGDGKEVAKKAAEEKMPMMEEQPMGDVIEREIAAVPPMASTGEFEYYEVKKSETLMWIAFKLYGDYRKWKDLAEWNGSHYASSALKTGERVKYIPSGFSWRPKGNPYLIQRGDYLSKISNKLYGTPNKWRSLWENNKPMIRYPDLIFAGFTLYYIPKDEMMY